VSPQWPFALDWNATSVSTSAPALSLNIWFNNSARMPT